jgi:hypothetical protein
VVQALKHNRAVLKNSSDAKERVVALAWILHLVGDIHQPLHNADLFSNHFDTVPGDRGGNQIHIIKEHGANEAVVAAAAMPLIEAHPRDAGEPEAAVAEAAGSGQSLHSYWDGAFASGAGGSAGSLDDMEKDILAAAGSVSAAALDEDVADVSQDSFKIANDDVYTTSVRKAVTDADPAHPEPHTPTEVKTFVPSSINGVKLSAAYQKKAHEDCVQQVNLAGLRLAHMLAQP